MRERLSFISLSSSSVDRSFFLSLSLAEVERKRNKEGKKTKHDGALLSPAAAPAGAATHGEPRAGAPASCERVRKLAGKQGQRKE